MKSPVLVALAILLAGCTQQPTPITVQIQLPDAITNLLAAQFISPANKYQVGQFNAPPYIFNPRTGELYVLVDGGLHKYDINHTTQPGLIKSFTFEQTNLILNLSAGGQLSIPTNTAIGEAFQAIQP